MSTTNNYFAVLGTRECVFFDDTDRLDVARAWTIALGAVHFRDPGAVPAVYRRPEWLGDWSRAKLVGEGPQKPAGSYLDLDEENEPLTVVRRQPSAEERQSTWQSRKVR